MNRPNRLLYLIPAGLLAAALSVGWCRYANRPKPPDVSASRPAEAAALVRPLLRDGYFTVLDDADPDSPVLVTEMPPTCPPAPADWSGALLVRV